MKKKSGGIKHFLEKFQIFDKNSRKKSGGTKKKDLDKFEKKNWGYQKKGYIQFTKEFPLKKNIKEIPLKIWGYQI